MEFSEVYERFIEDIKHQARSQYVVGLDYDDVVAEMVGCLWKAWKTHVPDKGSLGSYWWSLWLNRKSDIKVKAGRMKRPRQVLVDTQPERTYLMEVPPLAPTGTERDGQLVWRLLARGGQAKDVMAATGISRRRYYDLIRSWRTPDVHRYLAED